MNIILRYLKKNRKYALAIIDIVVLFCAFYISYYIMSLEGEALRPFSLQIFASLTLSIIVYEIFLNIFSVYDNITRYENGNDYLKYILVTTLSCLVILIINKIINFNVLSIRIYLLDYIVITVGIISYRIIIRMILTNTWDHGYSFKDGKKVISKKLLIIGAGSVARDIIKTIKENMRNEYSIVGIIDDNKNKINYSISGIRVLGDRNNIEKICDKYKVDIIFFTISNINAKSKKNILEKCQNTKAKIRILSGTEYYIRNKNVVQSLRDIDIEDVLYRDSILLDDKNIKNLIKDQTIIITGGGGSIGSELCRQIMSNDPKLLVILDIYENNLYDIELELKAKYDSSKIKAIIASVRDLKRIESIFEQYKPTLVFHAAAHKHVPLMEDSPLEAIKNNIFGTYNVINCCDKYNVKKFILISTDKAVNPTNIMGASKRLCEMMVQAKNKISKTDFVAVRFGNVLGSNGSVVPLFKKQIAQGGPVTVTDANITRYFMTIPEAVGLVLQAITFADGGEIFVLDMGKPVKIYDLAEKLIKLAGLEPNVDIEIKVVGLRPGEKLYEELLMAEEGLENTQHKKIFVAKPFDIPMSVIIEKLELLNSEIGKENTNINSIKKIMKTIVPTYIEGSCCNNAKKD